MGFLNVILPTIDQIFGKKSVDTSDIQDVLSENAKQNERAARDNYIVVGLIVAMLVTVVIIVLSLRKK